MLMASKNNFLSAYAGYYNQNIESIIESEFPQFKDSTYLDNSGSALYSKTQLQDVMVELITSPFGNPHSKNPSSKNSHVRVEAMRDLVLNYFNTSRKRYHLVFTSGATSGAKLIGELYNWNSGQHHRTFCYPMTSHNSIVGVREIACANGSDFFAFDPSFLERLELPPETLNFEKDSLMCFPAQCNYSGIKYPLQNVSIWQKAGFRVLLDAASLVSTSPLNLSEESPDFVVLSFYKIFGYPTGLGALLIKVEDEIEPNSSNQSNSDLCLKSENTKQSILSNKVYFGGGTVGAVLAGERWHRLRSGVNERFEDGTIDFLGVIALKHGFKALEDVGGIESIRRHTFALAHYLVSQMKTMKHFNGSATCIIHGWKTTLDHQLSKIIELQGPIVTFNLLKSDGTHIGYSEVERIATLEKIHLRTGCFCNPGACQQYLGLSNESVLASYDRGHRCWDTHDLSKEDGKPTGSVRVSIPYSATFEHIETFLRFLDKYFVEKSHLSLHMQRTGVESDEAFYPVLSSLIVYPIKSCGGMEVKKWKVNEEGLVHDREWTLIDASGRYVNQKAVPSLIQISPNLDLDSLELKINAPGMPTLTIPIDEYPDDEASLVVCGDDCQGRVYSDQVSNWFKTFTGVDLRLVRMAPIHERFVKANQAGKISPITQNYSDCTKKSLSFTNESQFLLVNESSIADLKQRIQESHHGDLTTDPSTFLNNFRPNIVVRNAPAYSEDLWRAFTIGKQHFTVSGPCNRCRMICINPNNGKSSTEPLLTLAKYRRTEGRILFGMLCVHDQELSQDPYDLEVGMSIKVSNK